MSFPAYPDYKESGVEWLGLIPKEWTVIAPKRVIRHESGGTEIKGNCALEPSDGLYPAFSASGQDVWLPSYRYDLSGLVLSAVGARCGKTFKADGRWGVVANTQCLIPSSDASRDYFWYLTNIENWWEIGGSAQPFVLTSATLDRLFALPPLAEQTQIARFLDHETACIDALIEEQQRLIELLKEKRQAVISHAVTKGLDPTVPMKDSGVEWLGEVPAHWELKKLRHIGHARNGLTYSPEDVVDFSDSATLVLRSSNIQKARISLEDNVYVEKRIPEALRVREGDLLICSRNGSRALIGKNALIPKELDGQSFGAFMMVFRSEVNEFIYWVLNSPIFDYQSSTFLTATINQLTNENLGGMLAPFPPPAEQAEIVLFLTEKTQEIDILISEVQGGVELLYERRAALISAAVTGKIDVRGWQPPASSQTPKLEVAEAV